MQAASLSLSLSLGCVDARCNRRRRSWRVARSTARRWSKRCWTRCDDNGADKVCSGGAVTKRMQAICYGAQLSDATRDALALLAHAVLALGASGALRPPSMTSSVRAVQFDAAASAQAQRVLVQWRGARSPHTARLCDLLLQCLALPAAAATTAAAADTNAADADADDVARRVARALATSGGGSGWRATPPQLASDARWSRAATLHAAATDEKPLRVAPLAPTSTAARVAQQAAQLRAQAAVLSLTTTTTTTTTPTATTPTTTAPLHAVRRVWGASGYQAPPATPPTPTPTATTTTPATTSSASSLLAEQIFGR